MQHINEIESFLIHKCRCTQCLRTPKKPEISLTPNFVLLQVANVQALQVLILEDCGEDSGLTFVEFVVDTCEKNLASFDDDFDDDNSDQQPAVRSNALPVCSVESAVHKCTAVAMWGGAFQDQSFCYQLFLCFLYIHCGRFQWDEIKRAGLGKAFTHS